MNKIEDNLEKNIKKINIPSKKNYNHISHRIIDKRWDEELEEWKYLPKGNQNALHDGCFITSKEIKYKLEMLIKIQN